MPFPESADLGIDVWGGLNTSIPPSQLPLGASPQCQDVMFPEAGVRTRDGLLSFFANQLAGNPAVNGLKTYITPTLQDILLVWDALGNLYQENPINTLALIAAGGTPQIFMNSTTLFGREYMGFGNATSGIDFPRQFDATNYDRVSQCGPGQAPTPSNFLPAAAVVQGAGPGAPINLLVAPNGAVASDPVGIVIPPYPPYYQGGSYTYYTTATYTTAAPHGLAQGQQVNIAGVGNATFNVVGAIVTVILSATSFKIALISYMLAASGGGTVTPQASSLSRVNNLVTATTPTPHGFVPGWTVQIAGFAALAVGGAATATQTNGIVTVTTATPHGIPIGASVIIAGMVDATYDTPTGATVLSVPTTTSFTYQLFTTALTTNGGTVSVAWNSAPGIGFLITAVPSTTSFIYQQLGPTAQVGGAGTATIVGNVTAGNHQVSIAWVTRQGFITRPAPPANFSAAGGQLAQLVLPIGPANTIARLVMFTPYIAPPATTGNFYSIEGGTFSGNQMLIQDNVTTTVTLDFSDSNLISGFNAQYLFTEIELGECYGASSYSSRTSWIGEAAHLNNLLNMEFGGGWNIGGGKGGGDLPLGWTSDPTSGAGGSRIANGGMWLDAYRITGDGAAAIRGMITQPAFQDFLGVNIFAPNTTYSVRVRAKTSVTAGPKNLTVELFSPSLGSMALVPFLLDGNPGSFGATYQTITAQLGAMLPAVVPGDLVLRVYANNTLGAGVTVTIDSIEPFQTASPVNGSVARLSYAFNPEAFDSVSGQVQIRPGDGQQLRAQFQIRGNMYYAKDRYLAYVKDDGQNEPASWQVTEVSQTIGICGPNAVDVGEEWAAFANENGVYVFWGSDPVKISQEIQEDASQSGKICWNSINWLYASKIWVRIDNLNKRILIGAPVGESNTPNYVFQLDYKFSGSGEEIADEPGSTYSAFTGRLLQRGGGRKWTIWNMGINSCTIAIRPDGTQQVFMGNGQGTGKVYQLKPGQYSDDGAAINSFYVTAGEPTKDQAEALQLHSHRHVCDYLSGRAIGAGSLLLAVESEYRTTFPRSVTLTTPGAMEFERTMNVHGYKIFVSIGTNGVGSWFSLEYLTPMIKADATVPVAGVV